MAQLDHLPMDSPEREDDLALSIMRKLDKVPYLFSTTTERAFTIFRVPFHIRATNKNFYEPRMVSIGPYHWRRQDLKCMEEQKLRYLKKMLHENPDATLNDYLAALRQLEPATRRCYHETPVMNSDEFIEMLLYDACFIIQLMLVWYFLEDDIAFDLRWNIPLIKSDLLMLENQIPYFVLQCVFDIYSSRGEDTSDLICPCPSRDESEGIDFDEASLSFLLAQFLQHGYEKFEVPEGDNNYDHLLDFYYQCYMCTQMVPTMPRKKFHPLKILGPKMVFSQISSIKRLTMRRRLAKIITLTQRKPRMIPCATELQEAGVTFKKAKKESIFGVHFSNGVLTIPYTSVEEARWPQIMNLVAFEQCSGQKDQPLTSYVVFMNCIVKTPSDVLILKRKGLIETKSDNEKAAAEFFNQLGYCSWLDYEEHHLAKLFQDVKKYCDSSWHKHRAKLKLEYFSNPRLIISVISNTVRFLF